MSPDKAIHYEDQIKKENIFIKYFETFKLPILILHPKTFKIIDINQSTINFFQYPASELKKRHLYDLVPATQVEEWKSQMELNKGKTSFALNMPLTAKEKEPLVCSVSVTDISISKLHIFAATIDNENSENIVFTSKLKDQNKELSEQAKKMVTINRRIVTSYENVKKQYSELLEFQEDNVKAERQRTIVEMIEVLQDKVNKPLNRILDDIQKVQDSEKKLDSSVVKRLKLIEESAENVLRLIARIAEIRDIKKMRYIELGNM